MQTPAIVFTIAIIIASYTSYKTGKLTLAASITGGFIALAIYMGTGFSGVSILAIFFVLATLATSHKKNKKSDRDTEKRDARQVLANGGLAGLLGISAFIFPDNSLLATILIAAAFASATADTLSSELGTVYGRRFYNITTLKPDVRGRDGVFSVIGILIGIAGSVVIAMIFALYRGLNSIFFNIIIAGTIGNITDSVLGATLERKGYMNNNEVNFLNTLTAVVVSCMLLLV